MKQIICFGVFLLLCIISSFSIGQSINTHSVARQWNEQMLWAIRLDEARPTVHARNLFHLSVAMWDAWAAFDPNAKAYLHDENFYSEKIEKDRSIAITYAAYR